MIALECCLFTLVVAITVLSVVIIIIIIIYRFLKRHKSLGYRGAGGVSIRRTVGIGKSWVGVLVCAEPYASKAIMFYFGLSFTNIVLRGHQMELNQTLLHIKKCTTFETASPKFGLSNQWNVGPKNWRFPGAFTTPCKRECLWNQTHIDKREIDLYTVHGPMNVPRHSS